MPENSKNYAFISYSHDDSELVNYILNELKIDYNYWIDESIPYSKPFNEIIATKITESSCFVAFFSQSYDKSEYCKNEIFYAKDIGVPILPVYLEQPGITGELKLNFGRIHGVVGTEDSLVKKLRNNSLLGACRRVYDNSNGNPNTVLSKDQTEGQPSRMVPNIIENKTNVRGGRELKGGCFLGAISITVTVTLNIILFCIGISTPRDSAPTQSSPVSVNNGSDQNAQKNNDSYTNSNAEFTELLFWRCIEKEKNDTMECANTIGVNTSISGTLDSENDVDYYVFGLPEAEEVSLYFRHESINTTNSCWKIELFSRHIDNPIISLDSNGASLESISNTVKLDKGSYFVCVRPGDQFSGEEYGVMVRCVDEDEAVEAESNR